RVVEHGGDRPVERQLPHRAPNAAAARGTSAPCGLGKRERAAVAPKAWAGRERGPTGQARSQQLDAWERMVAGEASARKEKHRAFGETARRPPQQPLTCRRHGANVEETRGDLTGA